MVASGIGALFEKMTQLQRLERGELAMVRCLKRRSLTISLLISGK